MMYLVENYPLGKTGLDKYIILSPYELYELSTKHRKMLDPYIGKLNLVSPGMYTMLLSDNSTYYLDTDPSLYNYVSNLTTNILVSDDLYKVSVDTEKTLYSALGSIELYKIRAPQLKQYLADISEYTIDTQLYNLYRNILRYRLGDKDMDDQSIIDAYNAAQQQLVDLENRTTAEILTKLLEVSDQVNSLSTSLSKLRPESNIYILTNGLIESFNHLVNVSTINTQSQ